MKKLLFTFLLAISFATVHAQQDYEVLLASFYQHSENGFKDITGKQTDTESSFYPSKLTAGIGEVKIQKSSYSYTTLNWIIPLAQSKAAQQAAEDFIKTTYADAKMYKTATAGPDEEDDTVITAVYMIKPDGAKPALVFQTMTDKKQFTITVYEKH